MSDMPQRRINEHKFTVYISGQITGLDITYAKSKFRAAYLLLESRNYKAINPFDLNSDDADWETAMLNDIRYLFNCDGIYMLNNWETSKGARIELAIAKELGLFIAYQPK